MMDVIIVKHNPELSLRAHIDDRVTLLFSESKGLQIQVLNDKNGKYKPDYYDEDNVVINLLNSPRCYMALAKFINTGSTLLRARLSEVTL